LLRKGYRVAAVEYPTYVPLDKQTPERDWNVKHFGAGQLVLMSILEGWDRLRDPNAIVVGFSLGGGALGVVHSRFDPMPAQLVFLNTFQDLPKLASDLLPIPRTITYTTAVPWMRTQWQTCPTPTPQNESGKRSRVLIVSTADDQLIPASHSDQLFQRFQCAWGDTQEVRWIVLPSGGHALGPLLHWQQWSSALLPP